MFINCPHCQALIATDPATDLPPAKCPRCAAGLREAAAAADAQQPADAPADTAMHTAPPTGADTATTPLAASTLPEIEPLDAKPAEAPDTTTGQARADLSTAIAAVISPIATLLKPSTQAPAASPATAQHAPARGPEPEDGTAAPPAPENTATAAPIATDAAANARQAPIGPAAATTAVADALAPVGEASGALQTMTEAADGSSTALTDEPATRSGAESAAANTDAPDTAAPRPSPDDDATTAVADATDAAATPASPPETAIAAAAAQTAEARPQAAGTATALPSFARTGTLPRSGFDWKTATAAVALALLLSLQLLLAGRAQLADDARWRPLVSTLCSAFGCTLPPWREPAAFTVLARDVRPHPSLPGVLRVTATLRNDARWSQPWPRLRLTLSDVDGNPIAARDFAAREYLGARSPPPQIASGQVAAFAMDIVEPAPRSVAFDFELH